MKIRKIFIRCRRRIVFVLFSPTKFFKKYFNIIWDGFFGENLESIKVDKVYTDQKIIFDKSISKKEAPRVLILINHYYNKKGEFKGKSSSQDIKVRKAIVEKVANELRSIPNSDVKVCGMKGFSLIDIDKDFSFIKDPKFLVYESIEWMFSKIDKYDYFVNIEDDILLTRETFERIIEFDKNQPLNKCFHPNRMEYEGGREYCSDFEAEPGWRNISMKYNNYEVRVAKNPHSGLTILSKPKMLYARDMVDLKRRERIIGYYMASAYANVNSPFLLYRSYFDLSVHRVVHLDRWEERDN